MRNDGPSMSFIPPEDTVKVTLDLSESGPVFSAMDEMMMKMLDDDAKDRKKNAGAGAAKDSLKKLLRSGIPGVEKMFAAPADPNAPGGKKGAQKGFHKMNDGSKKKFMTAIFGEDGTSVATETAAALLVATCAGGDPAIADNIAKLIIPEFGEQPWRISFIPFTSFQLVSFSLSNACAILTFMKTSFFCNFSSFKALRMLL